METKELLELVDKELPKSLNNLNLYVNVAILKELIKLNDILNGSIDVSISNRSRGIF